MTSYWCDHEGCGRMVAPSEIVWVEDATFGVDEDGIALMHRVFCPSCWVKHARATGQPLVMFK